MARDRRFGEWSLERTYLGGMDAAKARDILVDWFCAVHGPHFAQTKSTIGLSCDADTVRKSVQGAVRLAFREVRGDYSNPTRESVVRVLERLDAKSRSWGMPEDEAARQASQLRLVIDRIPAD